MQVRALELKNFRCFGHASLSFEGPCVLIEGANGCGKTSLLEALHYGCYLRSFRTYNPHHLIRHNDESFFIKVTVAGSTTSTSDGGVATEDVIQVGFSGKRRLVRLNEKSVCSYKELMDAYRVVTTTEDDLGLISGAPEVRRAFLDQALVLTCPGFIKVLTEYRKIMGHRTHLIITRAGNEDVYRLWTEQLWNKSLVIAQERTRFLSHIAEHANTIMRTTFGGDGELSFAYNAKLNLDAPTFDDWYSHHRNLYRDELARGRSIFGAHLDDFSINFHGAPARLYASRGQQKLLALLVKMAQANKLAQQRGRVVMLIDDFMTDFDEERANACFKALAVLGCQLIITSPRRGHASVNEIMGTAMQRISLPC